MTRRFASFLTLCLLVISNVEALPQDITISQFLANPLFTNPAFAGLNIDSRATVMYRNQWPGLYSNFESFTASYDQNLNSLNSGFGASFLSTKIGGDALVSKALSAYYAYRFKPTKQLKISLGIKGTYFQSQLNWGRVNSSIVYDTVRTMIGYGIGQPSKSSISNYSLSFGLAFTYNENIFGGFSIDHLNTPNISFYEDDRLTNLRIKTSIFAGINLNIGGSPDRPLILTPTVFYQGTTGFQQLNVGTTISKGPIFVGGWYRLDFHHDPTIIALIGLHIKQLVIGYSYDYTLSSDTVFNGGAHEVTLSLLINKYQKNRSYKLGPMRAPCF